MVRVTNALRAGMALAALFVLAACEGGNLTATNSPSSIATTAPAQEATAPTTPELAPTATASSASNEVSFSRDVLPLLQSRCINCHGGQRTSEGLDMKTYESLMNGSQNGSVISPGDAANSSFVTLAAEGKMPKRGPKLTPAEVQLLTDWVNAGAPNN